MSTTPKVSVCVVAYNQQPYIRQCLQSIIDQETDFDVEIIVGDDCSRDGTADIIRALAEQYPDKVFPLFHSPNLGGSGNYVEVHSRARGQYIAHMDGDDYMLPGKLQVQSDFLDRNPDHNVIWHRMMVRNESTGVMVEDALDPTALPNAAFRRSDILRFMAVGSNSAKMYRASRREFVQPGFPVLDYFANVEQVGDGLGAICSAMPLGVYRAGIGVSSSGNGTKKLYKLSMQFFAARYPAERRAICCAALVMWLAALKNRRWRESALFAPVWLANFHPAALVDVVRYMKVYRMLSLPAAVRKAAPP